MIEQDTVAGIHAVRLPVVHGNPVGIEFGNAVGATRIEWRGLRLRGLDDFSVKFRGGSLVEPNVFLESDGPDRVE